MRRLMLLGSLLTGLAALLACGGVFGGDRPVADACAEMFQKYAPSPSKVMLRDCEVFYTQYASDEQKAQLQCIARSWTVEAAADCTYLARQELPEKPTDNPDAGEGAKTKRVEGKIGKLDAKMPKAKETKVVLGTLLDLNCQPAPGVGVLRPLR